MDNCLHAQGEPRVLVLCYHAANVSGNDYATNDHLALSRDLVHLSRSGIPIVTVERAVDVAHGKCIGVNRAVALTFDDGIILDAVDFDHPSHGMQRSMLGVLADHSQTSGCASVAASFVIASPEARAELDRKDFLSLNVWHDKWWRSATESGLLSIESHSWDHNHPSLEFTAAPVGSMGNFAAVADRLDCDRQIIDASSYITDRCGRPPSLFAYPWGQGSAYLRDVYLPTFGAQAGLKGAFSIDPGIVSAGTNPWWLPRVVCGQHWRSEAEFATLVEHWLR